jgi:WD40 repeat protein
MNEDVRSDEAGDDAQTGDASQNAQHALNPRCVASTKDSFNALIDKKRPGQVKHNQEFNFFHHHTEFSPDGTSIITYNEDQILRTFILPSDLLDHDETTAPLHLVPSSSFSCPSNLQSSVIYPGFELSDASTTLVLTAHASIPITLRNAHVLNHVHASYPLVDANTEEHVPARSLVFSGNGSHFVAGGEDRFAIFDVSRSGEGPMLWRPLRRSKGARRAGFGLGAAECAGIVSAMSLEPSTAVEGGSGLFAVGTLSRQVGLFAHGGGGDCTAGFSIALERTEQAQFRGAGVSSIQWSPCGRYLLIAERQSHVIQVYDVRNSGRRLSLLTGRNACSMQRLGVDVVPTATGYEVWAGGTDGVVRMWSQPGSREGMVNPDSSFVAHQCKRISLLIEWTTRLTEIYKHPLRAPFGIRRALF